MFLSNEVGRWPPNSIKHLFEETAPASIITCMGCEERCSRPVEILASPSGREHIAVSSCHLIPGMGPFEHPIERLRRWLCTRKNVAKFVARQLGSKIKDHDEKWRRVRYTDPNSGRVRRALSSQFAGSLKLIVGGSEIPLVNLIDWNDSGILLDRSAVAEFAGASLDLQSGNKRTQPSVCIREDNKTMKEIRDRRLQKRLETLAARKPKANKETLCRLIERSGDFPGMGWSRIARVTRMPEKK